MNIHKYFLSRCGKFIYLGLVFLCCVIFDFTIPNVSSFFHDFIPLYAYLSSWTGREGKIFVWLFFSIAFFPVAFIDLFFEPLRHEDYLMKPFSHVILFGLLLFFSLLLFALDLNIDEAVGRAGRRFRDIKRIGLGYFIFMPIFSLVYVFIFSYSVSVFYFYLTCIFNVERLEP